MAMRVCIYCKHEITYERENRNLMKGGAVGFWTDPLTQQAACPEAPVDAKGQQLHNPGDVHTPPSNPEDLEKFLNGEYVPPPPAQPCGQMFGMSESGEILSCGLDDGHSGDCEAGTPVGASATAGQVDEGGPMMVEMGIEQTGESTYKVSATSSAMSIVFEFDTEKSSPEEVQAMLTGFPEAAGRLILQEVMGVDLSVVDAVAEAAAAAARPEPPKILEDPDDIEKFLRGEE